MSDHHYCQEYEDRGKPCGLLADCSECRCCWAHCWCDEPQDEYTCEHDVPDKEACEACDRKPE